MWELVGIFSMGVTSGIFSAILGLGGGIFLVPILTILFHLPIRVAVGTSLVSIIATSAGVAAVTPRGHGGNFELGLRLEVATSAGAILGSWLAGLISTQILSILFSIVVFMTAGYLFIKDRRARMDADEEEMFTEDYRPRHWAAGLGVAGFAGTVAGLLGVSGGFIKVPLMHALMEVPLGVATATSSFMVGITAAASVFIYYGRGDIHPLVAIPTALGIFSGAMLGVKLLPHLKATWLRTGLIGLLLVMGLQMLLQGV